MIMGQINIIFKNKNDFWHWMGFPEFQNNLYALEQYS